MDRFAEVVQKGLLDPLAGLDGPFHIAHEQVERPT
jgi:hypothetical protein